MKFAMPIQGEWLVFSDDDLLAMEPDQADGIRTLYSQYEQNKLAHFLAHGGGIDFLNDYDTDLSILFAGNRRGKSYAGAAWLCLRTIPTSPEWPCYTDGGLDYHEWEGANKVVACSYTVKNHIRPVIAPLLLEILPDHELKEFSPRYKGKGRKKINWAGDSSVPLACGSEVHFRAYEQDQVAFESDRYSKVWLDEQPPLARMDGLIERGRTGMDKTQFCSTATPHYVKGWPETGAAGPLVRALKGNLDLGISIKEYNINTEDVPDCIFPAEQKLKARIRWVDGPEKSGDQAQIREGRARYYGEPQSSEGLVVQQFDRDINVCKPFTIPKSWTRYRGLDHGYTNPSACSWAAVNPQGFLFFYRAYKSVHATPRDFTKQVVKKSGNESNMIDEIDDGFTIQKIYEETYIEEEYQSSVMDSRSFGSKSDRGCTLGELYNECGMFCTPASGKQDRTMVPIMNDWFRYDPDLKHPITGKMGSPRAFVFDGNGCEDIVFEFEALVHKSSGVDKNASEDINKKDDHLFDTVKYIIAENPCYMGNDYMPKPQAPLKSRGKSFTGY